MARLCVRRAAEAGGWTAGLEWEDIVLGEGAVGGELERRMEERRFAGLSEGETEGESGGFIHSRNDGTSLNMPVGES